MQLRIQIGPNGIVQKAKPSLAYFIYLAFIESIQKNNLIHCKLWYNLLNQLQLV